MRASATLRIKRGKERPFSMVKDGPKLTQGIFTTIYRGELQGEGILAELKVYYSESSATIYGLERITGTLAGKSGSFVLEHDGTLENGVLKSKRTVLPGAGTGDLAGLRGQITLQSGADEKFSITFDYDFAPISPL